MPLPWTTFPVLASRLVSDFRGDYNAMLEAILSTFNGPEEPPQLYAGMLWVDTSVTPRLLKQRNTSNTGWVIRAEVDTSYGGVLPLTGGTMKGPIDMGTFGLTNLPLGSGNAAARYADLAAYAKLDGTTPFTGIPSLPNQDPSTGNQAARKAYVDTKTTAGGTFVGQISMTVAPTDANHVVRNTELVSKIETHPHTGGAGGVKVQGGNLASQGIAAGRLLEADGSGGASWVLRPRFGLKNTPTVLVDDAQASTFIGSSSNETWKSVFLTGVVAAGVTGVLLQIAVNATGSGSEVVNQVRIFVRPTDSGVATSAALNFDIDAVLGAGLNYYSGSARKLLFFAGLDSFQRFDIALKAIGGASANLTNFRLGLWIAGEH